MMYRVDLDHVGRLLVMKGRAANWEVLRHYGSEAADFTQRNGFNAQLAMLRGLGIWCEVETDGNAGKELYTKITISGDAGDPQEWKI